MSSARRGEPDRLYSVQRLRYYRTRIIEQLFAARGSRVEFGSQRGGVVKRRMKRNPIGMPRGARPSVTEAQLDRTEGPARAEIAVRSAGRADVEAVIALDAKITDLPKPEHWRELRRRQRRAADASAGAIFLVAVRVGEPDRVLGFILGEIRAWEFGSAPCGWVYALSVEPEAREQGVGETLLAAVIGEFRKAGIDKMRTMVARDNLLTMSFFRGEGMMAGPYIELEKDLT